LDHRKKILLVEDDEYTRFMMKELVDVLEIEVDFALNGQECCERVNERPADYGLILMDIHMPKTSGIEAASKIRASSNNPPKNLPIIAVTADETYHDSDVVRKFGMNDFMAKPIKAADLKELVNKYC